MASRFNVDSSGIKKMMREIEREMAKNPVRVPMQAEANVGGSAGGGAAAGSELELVSGWLIDWAYAYSKTKPHSVPSVGVMMNEVGVQDFVPLVEPHVEVAVDALVEAGLLKDGADTFGSTHMTRPVWLSEVGRREAVARIERRKDNLARRTGCRDAVLRWAYERQANGESTEIGEIAQSPYGWFNGVLFSTADLAEAIAYLRERKLLGGTEDVLTIERAGIECIEQHGAIVDYLNRRDSGGVNVTIMGNNSGQLAVANRDVEQTQTQTNDAQVLTVFAQALRELGRIAPAERQPEFEQVASALEQEASKEQPDRGWIKSLLDRGRGLLERTENLQHVAQVVKVAFDVYNQTAG